MDTNTVFAKAHRTITGLLRTLVTDLMEALDGFGCGRYSDRELFATKIRKVMLKLVTCEPHEAPLATFELEGPVREKRATLIEEVLVGFGSSASDATSLASLALASDTQVLGRVTMEGGIMIRRPKIFCVLTMKIALLHQEAVKMYGRLTEILATINEPYRGTPMDPDAGVEQVVALMQRFPDLADTIYTKLGFRSTAAFPPVATGIAGDAERVFVRAVNDQVSAQWWWDTFKIAGLVIASVTITLISAGTLGPLAATLVGSGIGLTQGIVHVVDSSNKLQDTQDAHRFGAATRESVEHAEGEVQGAWGMLLVDTATGGLLGRFGGGPTVSKAMKLLRVTAISGVGSGLATATNPNVWRSQNTTAIIVFATVVGGASGAGGHFVSAGIARVLPSLGAKIQIGVSKLSGHLVQGKTVHVQLRAGEPPVSAKVVAVNRADATVMLEVEGKNLHVRVGKILKVSGSVFHGKELERALRPMQDQDFNPLLTTAYRVKPGAEPQLGVVDRRQGTITFTPMHGTPQKVKLEELRVFEKGAYVPPKHLPKNDVQHFEPRSNEYKIAPLKRHNGYYTAVRRQGKCNMQPKLRIVPGRDFDGGKLDKGAFNGWHYEGLPKIQMRGRHAKPTPQPDEVAVFMAHGSKTSFEGMSTRQAARAMADAIVDTNRTSGSKNPIRFCALSSCEQGNRRYFVTGKTNAEVFQKQLDMRLRELGIDPKGNKGITVLASDRMGSISGADYMSKKLFCPPGRTTFVPAGTQRPLSYPRDVANGAVKIVGLALSGAPGVLVIVSAADPDAFMEAVERFGDRIFGVIVDAPAKDVTLPQPIHKRVQGY